MGYAILPFLMFVATVVEMIRKGYGRALVINLAVFAFYTLIFVIGMVQAKGWDGLGWLLAGAATGGAHLFILFIVAMVLPNRNKQLSRQERLVAAQHRPKPMAPPANPRVEVRRDPVPASNQDPFSRTFDDFFEGDEGGELPFD